MEPQELLAELFDEKLLRILKFFIANDGRFYLREIGRSTRVSAASTYRLLNKLRELGILEVEEIKTAKLYRLADNKSVDFLKQIMEVDVVDYFVQRAREMDGVEEIMLLGSQTKSKANLLLLGSSIDPGRVKLLCAQTREKYNYTINQMTVTREQYEQMSSMGLYPGSKKTLFKR